MPGAADKGPPAYTATGGKQLLWRMKIIFDASDNTVLQPLWILKKGRAVDIIEAILFGSAPEYEKLRNRSQEKDEWIRYVDAMTEYDAFWRIAAKLELIGIGQKKGDERPVNPTNGQLQKLQKKSKSRALSAKNKATVDKARSSFFEMLEKLGMSPLRSVRQSIYIQLGYDIFGAGLIKMRAFLPENTKKTPAYMAIRDEFSKVRGSPEDSFCFDKLDASFAEVSDTIQKVYCNRDLAIIGLGLLGKLSTYAFFEKTDEVRFYQLGIMPQLYSKFLDWKEKELRGIELKSVVSPSKDSSIDRQSDYARIASSLGSESINDRCVAHGGAPSSSTTDVTLPEKPTLSKTRAKLLPKLQRSRLPRQPRQPRLLRRNRKKQKLLQKKRLQLLRKKVVSER
ncbi:unnamed protein product [Amoebophrya sp. A25]|nr:unnamed protein product [Amoebophrya sp. A25]|eukprot:GSA25T00008060001.1